MMMDGLDHPKTLDLSARLDASIPQVIGHLELLWAFVAQKTPTGNIGKWPDGTIARAAQWTGDATVFVDALYNSGFLDASTEHRYIVHDWPDHCPRWIHAKLKKTGQSFARANNSADSRTDQVDSSADCRADSRSDSSADSMPSHATPRQAKPSKQPPITPQGGFHGSGQAVAIDTFLANCKAHDCKPVPEDDPVFDYAEETGIPTEFLRLCWAEFVQRNRESGKRYKDWRSAFRKCVRGRWYKLWWFNSEGEAHLTSDGQQAMNKQGESRAA